jgi:hypothetical protein
VPWWVAAPNDQLAYLLAEDMPSKSSRTVVMVLVEHILNLVLDLLNDVRHDD